MTKGSKTGQTPPWWATQSHERYSPAGLPGTQLLTPGIGKGDHYCPRTTQIVGAGSLK